MSRIGKKLILVPDKVKVVVQAACVRVEGPKGKVETPIARWTKVVQDGNQIRVECLHTSKPARSNHGLMRALLQNAVVGVTTGFERKLDLNGVGYRVEKKGNYLAFTIGYAHLVRVEIPEGIQAVVGEQTSITLTSVKKQELGEFAAKLRGLRPPEPYKGKGIKYSDEVIRKKEGKASGR